MRCCAHPRHDPHPPNPTRNCFVGGACVGVRVRCGGESPVGMPSHHRSSTWPVTLPPAQHRTRTRTSHARCAAAAIHTARPPFHSRTRVTSCAAAARRQWRGGQVAVAHRGDALPWQRCLMAGRRVGWAGEWAGTWIPATAVAVAVAVMGAGYRAAVAAEWRARPAGPPVCASAGSGTDRRHPLPRHYTATPRIHCHRA